MVQLLTAGTPAAEIARERWSLARRIAFRFLCAYLVISYGQTWLGMIPGLPLARWVDRGSEWLAIWTGRHVFNITTAIDLHTLGTGSGDGLIEYLRIFCELTLAGAATVIWSLADRNRRDYTSLHQWLRLFVRYPLGIAVLSYGMAKVFPGQFGSGVLPLERLLEPYGHSSPMGILWTFMGHSRPYAIFCGAIEVAGGLLLFWQATTTLGALLVSAAMANVMMLNFAYDVPVKLYSSYLFLSAVFLLLPDLGRLVRVFVANQAVESARLGPTFSTPWRRRAATVLKLAMVGWALYQTTSRFASPPPRPPVNARYGIYEVQTFVVNGQPRPPVPMDATRWRRLIINESGGVTVQTMDDAMVRYRTRDDAANHTFELSTIFNPYEKITLNYREPATDALVVTGKYGGDEIDAAMRKVPVPSFLLATRGFHWVSEYPYNR